MPDLPMNPMGDFAINNTRVERISDVFFDHPYRRSIEGKTMKMYLLPSGRLTKARGLSHRRPLARENVVCLEISGVNMLVMTGLKTSN